ncbi:hypothetical protein E2C01_046306 [Portunus trituberculatus]|uniref:Uncharacterized protein n=1 Tax=Portunus trituberculatus TaxID=210409 RepID=A0A5B7G4I4_PORTR|nr:hypothetical protein [Portunus trituberculatus]
MNRNDSVRGGVVEACDGVGAGGPWSRLYRVEKSSFRLSPRSPRSMRPPTSSFTSCRGRCTPPPPRPTPTSTGALPRPSGHVVPAGREILAKLCSQGRREDGGEGGGRGKWRPPSRTAGVTGARRSLAGGASPRCCGSRRTTLQSPTPQYVQPQQRAVTIVLAAPRRAAPRTHQRPGFPKAASAAGLPQ